MKGPLEKFEFSRGPEKWSAFTIGQINSIYRSTDFMGNTFLFFSGVVFSPRNCSNVSNSSSLSSSVSVKSDESDE